MRTLQRRALQAGAGILIALVMAAGALVIAARTDRGLAWLADLAAALLSEPGTAEVTLRDVQGDLPWRLEIGHLAISDRDGPWIEADGVSLGIRPWALLRLTLDLEELRAERLLIERRPKPRPGAEAGGGGGFSLPPLRLRRLDLGRVILGEGLIGTRAALVASGRAQATAGGSLRLAVDIRRTDETAGHATLDTAYDRGRDELLIDLVVAEPQGGILSHALSLPGLPPLEIALEGSGPGDAWLGSLEIAAGDFARWRSSIEARWVDRPAITLAGDGRLGSLVPNLARTILGDALSLAAEISWTSAESVTLGHLEAGNDRFRFSAEGRISLEDLAADLKAALEIAASPDLVSALAPGGFDRVRLDAVLSGPLSRPMLEAEFAADTPRIDGIIEAASWQGNVHVRPRSRGGSDITLQAALDGVKAGLTQIEAFAGPGITIDAAATLAGSELALSALTVTGRAATLSAEGQMDLGAENGWITLRGTADGIRMSGTGSFRGADGGIGASAMIDIEDLARQGAMFGLGDAAAVAGGPIHLELDLGAPAGRSAMTFDARFRGEGGFGPVRTYGGRVSIQGLTSMAAGAIEAEFDGVAGPGALSAKLGWDEAAIRISDATLSAEGIRIDGRLLIPRSGATPVGEVSGRALDLGIIGRRLGTDMAGAIVFEAALGEREHEGTVSMTGTGIKAGGAAAREISLAGRFGFPGEASELDLRLDMAGVAAGPLSLGEAALVASGTPAELHLKAAFREIAGGGRADAEGRLGLGGARATFALEALQGNFDGLALRLNDTARLTYAEGTFEVADFDLSIGDGHLTANGRYARDGAAVSARGTELPVAPFAAFVGASGLDGRINATFDFVHTMGHAEGRLDAAFSDMHAPGFVPAGTPGVPGRAHASWDGSVLAFDASIGGGENEPFEVTARLGLPAGPVGTLPAVAEDGPLSGRLVWRGALAPLWAYLPLPQHALSGDATIDIAAGGSPAAPELTGDIEVSNGSYEHLTVGFLLEDVSIVLHAPRSDRLALSLAASDGNSGRITVEGEVRYALGEEITVDAALDFADATVARRDDVTAIASGSGRLYGPLSLLKLEGTAETSLVEIEIANRLPATVVPIEIVERGDGRAESRSEPEGASAIEMDIAVAMPRRVFVRGRGLDTEWAGRLTVRGTGADPVIGGRLEFVRGTLSLAGQTFQIREGVITLREADWRTSPLRLVLAASRAGIEAAITVGGTLGAPTLQIASSPPLPEDEVLARLFFDKSVSNLSAIEAVQLAEILAEAGGIGGGGGPLSRLRKAVGLDVLRLESAEGETGQMSVGVGKYLSDDIYVGVSQGTTAGSTGVTVEIDVTDNITIQTDMEQDAQSKVGIEWKWDY